jgi:hypothetical protein
LPSSRYNNTTFNVDGMERQCNYICIERRKVAFSCKWIDKRFYLIRMIVVPYSIREVSALAAPGFVSNFDSMKMKKVKSVFCCTDVTRNPHRCKTSLSILGLRVGWGWFLPMDGADFGRYLEMSPGTRKELRRITLERRRVGERTGRFPSVEGPKAHDMIGYWLLLRPLC